MGNEKVEDGVMDIILLTKPLKPTLVLSHDKERKCLFDDGLNTFYLRLYGVRHMIKNHSDSERRNQLLSLHVLLF